MTNAALIAVGFFELLLRFLLGLLVAAVCIMTLGVVLLALLDDHPDFYDDLLTPSAWQAVQR